MTPAQRYERDLEQNKIVPDHAQFMAVQKLQDVYLQLLQRWNRKPGWFERLAGRFGKRAETPVRGLYFWGGVGRGKTCLMDMFYQCLPGQRKMRMHFHRFMRMVHQRLNEHRGSSDPLKLVAGSIAAQADVICFDEFFVSDIGDAMILANLLETLFEAGVTLIATSNIEPELLYERGLQRQKFIPAIELIKVHTEVINVDGGQDYRLRRLEQAALYHWPLGSEAESIMGNSFRQLAAGLEVENGRQLDILGRQILTRSLAEGLVWFDFPAICDGPRSAADYIEIAQLFHTVLLTNLPVLGSDDDDKARRFISLVDEFYDHKVKLIISAATAVTDIYQGTELTLPFRRTVSRLLEMQSVAYLALEHMP